MVQTIIKSTALEKIFKISKSKRQVCRDFFFHLTLSADVGLAPYPCFSPVFELERFFNTQLNVSVLLFKFLIISHGCNAQRCPVPGRFQDLDPN